MPILSLTFLLVFFPACALLYALSFFSRPAQNLILFLASLVFYAFGQTTYILVLLFSILWNYAMGLGIGVRKSKGYSGKMLAGTAVFVNVLLWLFFHLADPIKAALPVWFGREAPWPFQLLMPLGLAWYTLQAAGYCLQVYRGEVEAEKNPLYVGLHLAFFPKISMGPLVDFSVMRDQFVQRKHTVDKISRGSCRFVIGLSKKLFLADRFNYIVNYIFTNATMDDSMVLLPISLAWFGAIAFGLQLYYTLSGYTDMAIGLGNIFGFDLPENFNYPFTAASLTDFWKRWNITPLTWFKKYVFGSMRKSDNQDLVLRNLLVVWILFAMWTGGLDLTFLIWGVLNFLVLLAEYFFEYSIGATGRSLRHICTLLIVLVGFVLLRSTSLYNAGQYFAAMFGLSGNRFWSDLMPVFLREYWAPLGFGILFAIPLAPKWKAFMQRDNMVKVARTTSTILYPLCIAGLLALSLIYVLQSLAVNTAVY